MALDLLNINPHRGRQFPAHQGHSGEQGRVRA
jgi:hypothetical protein